MSSETTQQTSDCLSFPSEKASLSAAQSVTSTSFLAKFISTGSFSESSSFEISNEEQDSIVIKNVFQDYDGLLEVLDGSEKRIFDKNRVSLALTTAKGSLLEESKKEPAGEIHVNSFAVPGKFFCKRCMKDTVSLIKFQPLAVGFWNSVCDLFYSSKCCVEKVKYPDILHECPSCKAILARITSI